MAEKKVIELEIHTSSLSQLKKDLKAAQNEVAELSHKFGSTSDQAIEAAKRAAELKHQINETKKLTDAFHPEGTFNALTGSLEGVVRGLEVYSGAMGLIGVESKDVEQAILKVQSVMALAEGIKGIKESADSFKQLGAVIGQTAIGQKALTAAEYAGAAAMKVLNTVMKANPIGLVIAAITALVGAIAFFTRETGNAKEASEKYTHSLQEQRRAIDANFETLQKRQKERIDLMKAQGKTEQEIFEQEQKNTKKLADEKAKAHVKEKLSYQNLRRLYKQLMDQGEEEEAEKMREQLKSSRERYLELQKQSKEYYHQIAQDNAIFVAENAQKVKENAEKVRENARKVQEQQREDAREAYKKQLDDKKDAWEKEKELSQKNADEILESIKKRTKKEDEIIGQSYMTKKELAERFKAESDKFREEEFKDAQGYLNADLIANQYNFDAKRQLLDLQQEHELQNAELTEGEITDIKAKYAKQRSEIDKEEMNMKINAVQNALQIISNLNQLFAGKNEKQQKRAFEIQKAVNIASAIIDTYKAANTALASAPPPFNFIEMAAVITAGLLNVKNIASQQFTPSGGNNVPTPTAPSGGAGGNVITPNFNIVGNAQATNPLTGLGTQPIQAYVVSGEVTTAQNLDRNRINYATFG